MEAALLQHPVVLGERLEKAVQLLEKAERSAVAHLGIHHENYLTILNDLGTAYRKAKDCAKAERTLQKTLELKSEVYPVNNKEVILSIMKLAGFYQEKGSGACVRRPCYTLLHMDFSRRMSLLSTVRPKRKFSSNPALY